MQEECNTKSQTLQRRIFGERYVGATLARSRMPRGSSGLVQAWIEKAKGFLVLTGPAGTGKTYFCAALMEIMAKRMQSIRCYSERDLLRRVRASITDGSKGDYFDTLRYLLDDELIIIDDIGSSGHTEWREEVLMEAIDMRYNQKKPTVFTSNLGRKEMKEVYGQRIASRLFASSNVIIDMAGMEDLRESGL